MKKALLTILICGAMIFCISGCSDKQNTSKDDKEVPKEVSNLKQKYSDVKKDDLKWDYNSSTKTIIISGKGMFVIKGSAFDSEDTDMNFSTFEQFFEIEK